MHAPSPTSTFSLEELRTLGRSVAERLTAGSASFKPGTAIGRNQLTAHAVATELWNDFIRFRTALYERGIYDPLLGRFDSATVPQATNEETAGRLSELLENLA